MTCRRCPRPAALRPDGTPYAYCAPCREQNARAKAKCRGAGCSGCGSRDHTVPDCLSEGAARFYERRGDVREAATIRRLLADLERARSMPIRAEQYAERRKDAA